MFVAKAKNFALLFFITVLIQWPATAEVAAQQKQSPSFPKPSMAKFGASGTGSSLTRSVPPPQQWSASSNTKGAGSSRPSFGNSVSKPPVKSPLPQVTTKFPSMNVPGGKPNVGGSGGPSKLPSVPNLGGNRPSLGGSGSIPNLTRPAPPSIVAESKWSTWCDATVTSFASFET